MPFDFCEKACVLVDEFRRKTYNLEEEWVIYFDYSTGEVIYCFEGTSGECKCKYERINFNNKNIASIHNHPMNYFSFPSPNNFDILKNDFEDYEIIIAFNSYWIIKYKGIINENEKKIINEEIKFIINEIGNKIIQNNNYDKDKINYKIEYNVSEFLLNYFNKKTKIKAYKMEYE